MRGHAFVNRKPAYMSARLRAAPQQCQPSLPQRRGRASTLPVTATVLRPETRRQSWSSQSSSAAVLDAPPQQEAPAPVLLSKLVKAHAARISALVVLKDTPDCKVVVSSSLDKILARWKMTLAAPTHNGNVSNSHLGGHHMVACTRLAAPGGPVFSLVRQPKPATGSVFTPTANVLYCGNAAKEVVAWEVKPITEEDEPCDASFQTVATDYTGWVRSLALMGKWLFSCGCNFLVQHDTSFPIPKELSKQELFKGDIQAIVTSTDHVYIASADGMLRAWKVAKNGAMTPAGEVMAAHADRISCLALHGSTLYSTSFDGSIKAWNVNTLEAVAAVPAAHEGEKIHAIVLGSDGLLYTGGDDKLIRSWTPLSPALDFLADLEPVACPPSGPDGDPAPMAGVAVKLPLPSLPPAGPPLISHESGVRVLAAGAAECLVSGDSDGDMCVWALPRFVVPAASGVHAAPKASPSPSASRA